MTVRGLRPVRRAIPVVAIALGLALTSGARPVRAAVGIASDPLGDTLGLATPQIDVSQWSAIADAQNLQIEIDWATPSPAPQLGGLIDIDADRNPATGGASYVDFLCPSAIGLGAEYRIDLFSALGSGQAAVTDAAWNVIGHAQVTQEASRLLVTVPRSLLGGAGQVDLGLVLGPAATEVTDCAGPLTSDLAPAVAAIPALGPLGIAALAALLATAALLGLRRGRG